VSVREIALIEAEIQCDEDRRFVARRRGARPELPLEEPGPKPHRRLSLKF
jgi:hypothetical protein